jgi:hypothetical protein
MPIVINAETILFKASGIVAMDIDCCCDEPPCPDLWIARFMVFPPTLATAPEPPAVYIGTANGTGDDAGKEYEYYAVCSFTEPEGDVFGATEWIQTTSAAAVVADKGDADFDQVASEPECCE